MTRGRGTPKPETEPSLYVYGVAEWRRAAGVPELSGIEGILPRAPLHVVAHADLLAFVSPVPEMLFGSPGQRAPQDDAEWLRERVLAHERVLETVLPRCTLVPFRFGTICRDPSQVAGLLARHEQAFRRALDRVRGAAEWGVKLYCDMPILRQVIEDSSPTVRRVADDVAGVSPGVAFFLRKRLDKVLGDEVAARIDYCVARSRQRLGTHAREEVSVAVPAPNEPSRAEALVLNVAYLVAEPKQAAFRRDSAALGKAFAGKGFRFAVTGPWPAYHFASVDSEGSADEHRIDAAE